MANFNKPYTEWEKDELLDALEALGDLLDAEQRVSKYGVSVDTFEVCEKVLEIMDELNRRDTEEQAEELAAYYKAVIAV